MRRDVLLLAGVALAMLLASGVAFVAVVKGTPGDDKNLARTPRCDTIYGYGVMTHFEGTGAATRSTAGAAATS
jgi:hypothetical protein